MAWDEYERNGIKVVSGDIPIDEIALALAKIIKAYDNHFNRKPNTEELLHAFESLLCSNPKKYVADPEGLYDAEIVLKKQ